jgi:hypothetical protein
MEEIIITLSQKKADFLNKLLRRVFFEKNFFMSRLESSEPKKYLIEIQEYELYDEVLIDVIKQTSITNPQKLKKFLKEIELYIEKREEDFETDLKKRRDGQ